MDWQEWSPEVFARAAVEHRLVLVDVGAVWCHWCHVMDEQTYGDPAIQSELDAHYFAVRVDQDALPDVSQRYERWGWPATIVLAADGTELAKLRGYIPAPRMLSILQAFAADPTPGPSALEAAPAVPESVDDARLVAAIDAQWDDAEGGWGTVTKSLDADQVLWALGSGSRLQIDRARETIELERQLLDPAWGGVWQYSDSGDWVHPHYEKLATFQADDLRVYALAWAAFGEPADRDAAYDIYKYSATFLSDPEGGWAPSQDADLVPGEHAGAYFALGDAERRAAGIPRVDPHRYASTAGLFVRSLADSSGWLGDERLLAAAVRTARWAIDHRGLAGGGFRHDVADDGGPWLADSLAMGEGFLALYAATADREWLDRAVGALSFVDARFRDAGGYRASASDEGIPGIPPLIPRDDNARVARLAHAAWQYTRRPELLEISGRALARVTAGALEGAAAPVLLAERETAGDALRVVVVGPRSSAGARALFDAARALPVSTRRIEWFDPSGPALPRDDADYPETLGAYLCAGGACGPPARDPAGLRSAFERVGVAR